MPDTLPKAPIRHCGSGHWAVAPGTVQWPRAQRSWGLLSTAQLSGVRRGSARAPAQPSCSQHWGHICQWGCREPRCSSGLSLAAGEIYSPAGLYYMEDAYAGDFFFPIVS